MRRLTVREDVTLKSSWKYAASQNWLGRPCRGAIPIDALEMYPSMKSSSPSPVYAPPGAPPKLKEPRAVRVSMNISLRRMMVTPVFSEWRPVTMERLSARCQICPPFGFHGAPVRSPGSPSVDELCEIPKLGGPHSSGLRVSGSWSARPSCVLTSVVKLVSNSSRVKLRFQPARASLNTFPLKM